MKNHNLAFIDVEMTGLNPVKHENLENADPVSLKVSNYNEKDWGKAVPLPEAIKILLEKAKDCIMVGHNVAFDSLFLETAFAKLGVANTMHYHKLDTVSIAWAKLHRAPDVEHFSLRELCLRFGIENPKAHTALSDARATFELYKKLMEF